jgi:hypothetical protein
MKSQNSAQIANKISFRWNERNIRTGFLYEIHFLISLSYFSLEADDAYRVSRRIIRNEMSSRVISRQHYRSILILDEKGNYLIRAKYIWGKGSNCITQEFISTNWRAK